MAKDLTVEDHLRKSKWHNDHPNVGNANLGDSHRRSAILKTHLASVEAAKDMDTANKEGFAFR